MAEIVMLGGRGGGGFYQNRQGHPEVVKDKDSVDSYTLNYADTLDTGETLTSSTFEANGVTVDSSSLASPKATVTISETGGYIKNTVVTSSSRTLVQYLFFSPITAGKDTDYRC